MKIAVAQLEVCHLEPEKNFRKIESCIRKASADVIIFPELCLTGPLFGKKEFVDNGKFKKRFQELAKRFRVDIVTGSFIEGKGRRHNVSYYIDSKGKIKERYEKVHLWHPERKKITPGKKSVVFQTRFGKAGLIICWDLFFPELFREMMKKGVKIVYCPSWWGSNDPIAKKYAQSSEKRLVNSLCTTRAYENEILLVYCNAVGNFRYKKYSDKLIGQSQITVPFIGKVNGLEDKEGMFVQKVNLKILDDAERLYRARKDLKK